MDRLVLNPHLVEVRQNFAVEFGFRGADRGMRRTLPTAVISMATTPRPFFRALRYLRRSVVTPRKHWSLGESPLATRQSSLWGMIPAKRTKEPGPPGKKWRKIHCVLDAGGGAHCYNRGYCESGSAPGSVHLGNVGLGWRNPEWLPRNLYERSASLAPLR